MANTTATSPGTMAAVNPGWSTWINPSNAKVEDSSFASNSTLTFLGTDIADASARIVKSDGAYGTTNKSIEGSWSVTNAYVSYGGSADLWGETWTPADINNSNFGFALNVAASGYKTSNYLLATNFGFAIPAGATINGILVEVKKYQSGGDAFVDHIRITVYYTETNAGTITGVQSIQGVQSITL